jgi:hypothetical protein
MVIKLYVAFSGVQMRTEGNKIWNICVTISGLVFVISLADLAKTSYDTNYRELQKNVLFPARLTYILLQ